MRVKAHGAHAGDAECRFVIDNALVGAIEERPMKKLLLALALLASASIAMGQDMSKGADNFYRSDKVTLRKVSFDNQYKMKVVGNLFTPRDLKPGVRYAAIVVGHPMGAVKEQSSNLYAQKLAEQGFVTLAIDQSFWARARASRATPSRRTSMPRRSARRWTTWARGRSSTGTGSACSASAAAAASSSARRRSTRA